jgi:hypothetical protein
MFLPRREGRRCGFKVRMAANVLHNCDGGVEIAAPAFSPAENMSSALSRLGERSIEAVMRRNGAAERRKKPNLYKP